MTWLKGASKGLAAALATFASVLPGHTRSTSPGSAGSLVVPWRVGLLALAFASFPGTSAQAYSDVVIENTTEYTVSGTVHYGGSNLGIFSVCKNDNFTIPGKKEKQPNPKWSHSRGACLITGISGRITPKHGESGRVVSYDSSGTGYSGFLFAAYGGGYRFFSYTEYNKVTDTRQGKSPGFYLVNETDWPVAYSFDQVGCLYHGIVPTGTNGRPGVMKIDTGAVWFTLRAHIQPDGRNPQSDLDCVEPVAQLVGEVAIAALSGGQTAVAQAAGKIIVKTVVKEVIKAGIKKAGKQIVKRLLKEIAKEELGRLFTEATSIELYGQYAGYEWPFRCDNMPEYHITGGPKVLKDETGDVYLEDGPIFTVTKTNTCGNDMMLASRRSQSAGRSFFSSYDNPAAVATGNAGAGGAATNWAVGDIAEVKTPRDATWRIATVLDFDATNGILIRYSDTAERNWMPPKFMRPAPPGTVAPGAPGGVASQWKAGDTVEVQRPADGRWTVSSVLQTDPVSGVFIRYQDSGEQMWVPQTIVRAPQQAAPGAPGGVASQWKAGDTVEVQRPADGRWTVSSVMALDPINGVLITYQDSGQQMWVPQTSVRGVQVANAPAGGGASQWKVGDVVEVEVPAEGRWVASSVMALDPINGVLITFQDSGQQMWVPESSVRARQAAPGGAPGGVASQWNVGDVVEVQRPADGQWTVSSVNALDPINGVLITYQDSSQQMWVPESIVRAMQSGGSAGQAGMPGGADPRSSKNYSAVAAADKTWCVDNWGAEGTSPYYECMDQMIAMVDPNAAGGGNAGAPSGGVPGAGADPRASKDYGAVQGSDKTWCVDNWGAEGTSPYYECMDQMIAMVDPNAGAGGNAGAGTQGGVDPRSSKDYSAVQGSDKTWCVDNWGAEGTTPFYDCMDQMVGSVDPNAGAGGNAGAGTQGGIDPRSSKDYGAVQGSDKTWCVDNWGAEGTSPYYECMDQMIAMVDPNAASGGTAGGGTQGGTQGGTDPRGSKDYSAVQDMDKTWCVDNWGAEGTTPFYDCMDQMVGSVDPNAANAGGGNQASADPRGSNDYSAVDQPSKDWCADNWGAAGTSPYYDCLDQMMASIDPNAANAGGGNQGSADPRASNDYSAVDQLSKDWCADNWGAAGTSPYYDCLDEVTASIDPNAANAAGGGNQGSADPRASNDYSAVQEIDKSWCVDNWGAEGTTPFYDCMDQMVGSVDPNAGAGGTAGGGTQGGTDPRASMDYSAVDQGNKTWCVDNWGAEGTSPYYDCMDQMLADLTANQGQQQTYDEGQQQVYQDEQQQTSGEVATVNEAVYYDCLATYPDPESAEFADCYWANAN